MSCFQFLNNDFVTELCQVGNALLAGVKNPHNQVKINMLTKNNVASRKWHQALYKNFVVHKQDTYPLSVDG